MAEKLMTIPLSSLRRSLANIRKTDTTRDLEELAASIAAHGLLQKFVVGIALAVFGIVGRIEFGAGMHEADHSLTVYQQTHAGRP